ncbi:MAG: lysozyme inhibitor LprI family protein [Xanthobacteraceae bacterium]
MTRAALLTAFLLASIVCAGAQDVRPADRAAIDACLQKETEAPERCIGAVYKPCTDAPQGPDDRFPPGSTAGRGDCAERETAVWWNIIDTNLKQLLDGPLGKTVAQPWNRPPQNKRDHAVPGTDIINDMQQTWVVWRAKKCDTAAMQYEEGTLSRVIYGVCIYEETGRHALWLKSLVEDR